VTFTRAGSSAPARAPADSAKPTAVRGDERVFRRAVALGDGGASICPIPALRPVFSGRPAIFPLEFRHTLRQAVEVSGLGDRTPEETEMAVIHRQVSANLSMDAANGVVLAPGCSGRRNHPSLTFAGSTKWSLIQGMYSRSVVDGC
jgi:hypothetical protein